MRVPPSGIASRAFTSEIDHQRLHLRDVRDHEVQILGKCVSIWDSLARRRRNIGSSVRTTSVRSIGVAASTCFR